MQREAFLFCDAREKTMGSARQQWDLNKWCDHGESLTLTKELMKVFYRGEEQIER